MSTDFETMPTGTRAALVDAAKRFREYEAHHRSKIVAPDHGYILDVRGRANSAASDKAERNQRMAERIERLLEQ